MAVVAVVVAVVGGGGAEERGHGWSREHGALG